MRTGGTGSIRRQRARVLYQVWGEGPCITRRRSALSRARVSGRRSRDNVYRAGSWGYTASMPMIFGIGLSPLLQWLILPPVMVGAYRTLAPVLFGQHSSRSPRPTRDRGTH